MLLERRINFLDDVFIRNNGTVRLRNRNNKFVITYGYKANNGYRQVKVQQRKFSIHRLVAQYFVKNPCYGYFKIVHHKDSNTENNNSTNLQWLTQQLNCSLRKSNLSRSTSTGKFYPYFIFCGKVQKVRKYFKNIEDSKLYAQKIREELFENKYNEIINSYNTNPKALLESRIMLT